MIHNEFSQREQHVQNDHSRWRQNSQRIVLRRTIQNFTSSYGGNFKVLLQTMSYWYFLDNHLECNRYKYRSTCEENDQSNQSSFNEKRLNSFQYTFEYNKCNSSNMWSWKDWVVGIFSWKTTVQLHHISNYTLSHFDVLIYLISV